MRPLQGIRVLDLSRVLAGPFAGRMLADLGADVVKVEPPEGDITRWFGIRRGAETGYYAQQNAGKRGICVDLRRPEGPALVRRLAAAADVVIENFRPGVLAAFGLDWAALSADHPALVMLSITGFGQDGPEADRPAYAGVLHAEMGLLARQAATTGQRVEEVQLSIADTNAGLHGLVAVLAALRVRDATGLGDHIDLAMVDSMLITDDYVYWALDDGRPAPRGSGEVWEAAEGPVILIGDFKVVWKYIHENCGLADPTPPGADLPTKIAARRGAVGQWIAAFGDHAALGAALDRAGLAWGAVRSTAEAVHSPTVVHRASVRPLPDGRGGTWRVIDSPYRFARSTAGVAGPAPRQGEHNADVLASWLDLDAGERDALEGAGVLLAPSQDPAR
jgi:CoA:oxalate CoA-transferase